MNTNNQDSSLRLAVPSDECSKIPANKPVDSSAPSLQEKQPGHIPIDPAAIDHNLREIPQYPYTNGTGDETRAHLQVSFFPHGFTVSTVLSGDQSEIVDPDGALPAVGGRGHPEKRALHVDFCNPAYAKKAHMKQARVVPTRGEIAIFAAEQIKEIIAIQQKGLPNFPYKLEQVKVLSVDVRSRGTVQPRLFVDGLLMAQEQ
uniref:Cytochrome P450 monooxygenase AKT7 ) n=1 Tax=Ganoderma boninense TaxID=34458 RepID=A0A5K1JXV4_9APHY|nr:Cytochrome P450 monooxygenase AKT7 (EC (AK-toxin biosynthesis protein 7) [Ganoderma boninense]